MLSRHSFGIDLHAPLYLATCISPSARDCGILCRASWLILSTYFSAVQLSPLKKIEKLKESKIPSFLLLPLNCTGKQCFKEPFQKKLDYQNFHRLDLTTTKTKFTKLHSESTVFVNKLFFQLFNGRIFLQFTFLQ